MSAPTFILIGSIIIRYIAVCWSMVLLVRHRDWRMGTLTAMLSLMAVRQTLSLITYLETTGDAANASFIVDEFPGLLVSILALVFVALLERIISSERRGSVQLRSTEQQLRETNVRLRVMLEQLPAVVWTTDADLRFTSSLGAALARLGLEPGQAVGSTLYEFFGTDDESFPAIQIHQRVLEGESISYEQDWVGFDFHCMVEPLRDSDGSVVGTLGVALDVSDLSASQQALRRSEERYRDFLTQTAEGIWRLELSEPMNLEMTEEEQIDFFYRVGTLAECSDSFARMYGLDSSSVLVSARLDEIFAREDPRNRAHLRAFIRRGYSLENAEISELHDQDRRRYFELSLTGITEDGHLHRIWGIKRDVTEHREADRALKASEEKFRELFEASQDTVFISTPEGRLIDINPAGLDLLGYESKEEMLQLDISREIYADPEERRQIVQVLNERGACRDVEIRLRTKGGSEIFVLETTSVVRDGAGRVISHRGMLRDVTQERKLQGQLLRSQRMDAVGRLAGGVAHDFNNLLTVINGRSDLLRSLLEPASPLITEIDEIKAAGRRAAALTRQLLILSRRQMSSPQAVSLNQIIEDFQNLLHRSIGERIDLVAQLDPELSNVKADASQIEQVLLNLALNARDAMPHGGRLVIATENAEVVERSSLHALGLKPGSYVLLRVEDTGVGIDATVRESIFEPFVTTKGPGEGTGLGLSTVYGIVQQAGGHVRVESESGRGACFEILLPAVDESVSEPAEPVTEPVNPRGSETILLVEDEAAVRSLLRRFLDSQGYRVLEADDGEAALAQAGERLDDIDLLLTDLVMPGIGGFELARRLEARAPALKVIYMSGYSEEAVGVTDHDLLVESRNFLQKPFSTDLLARRVRAVLEAQ